MRTAKYILLPALLLTLLLLAVRGPWTQRLAPLVLSWAGLQQVDLDLAGFDSEQMRITGFAATLNHPAGPINITITDAVCSYQLKGLLRGRADAIRVATVAITLPPAPVNTQEPAPNLAPPDPAGLMRWIGKARLPVRQLHIQQLLIQRDGADPKKALALTVDLTTTEEGTQVIINPAAAGPDKIPALAAALRVRDGQLTGTLQLQLSALQGLLPAIDFSPLTQGNVQAELHAGLQPEHTQPWHLLLTITGLRHLGLAAKEIKLQLDSSRPLPGQPLILAPTSQLSLKGCSGSGVTVAAAEANLAGQVDLRSNSWRLQLIPATPWTIDGLTLGALRFAPLPFSALTADLRLDRGQLQAACSFAAPQGAGSLTAELAWQRSGEQKGTASLRTTRSLVMSESSNLLRLLADPVLPVTLDSGALNLSSLYTWSRNAPPALQTTVEFTGGQGSFYGAPFSGLAVQQQLRILPRLESLKSGNIELVQLQGPVPVNNLLLKTSLRPSTYGRRPHLLIEQADAELFGGKVRLENCAYDRNNPQSDCLLQIEGFDLPRIIALQKVEGLTASGRVGGNLPLHFTPQGIIVNQGQLENGPEGGIIRYLPAGTALQHSPLTTYALKALEEFHYQRLAASVQYIPDGTLTVSLQLQGNNPKLDSTRPIHLNINTEQNLLSLLKSLQYSQSLTSELDRQIQPHPISPRAH